jgi:hypothetical protein
LNNEQNPLLDTSSVNSMTNSVRKLYSTSFAVS